MKSSEIKFPLIHNNNKILDKNDQNYVEKYIYKITFWTVLKNSMGVFQDISHHL